MSLEKVNPYYLQNLYAVQDKLDVRAAQDIYAANGMKLLARGARIDAKVGGQLTQHRLRQPLETQLVLAPMQLQSQLQASLEQLLERESLLSVWLGDARQALLSAVMTLKIDTLAQQTLTLTAARFPDLHEHILRVLAIAWRLSSQPSAALMLGALFHDVSNLYMDAMIWQRQVPLSPSAWRQLDAHPLVGFVWARELKAFSGDVAQLILQHHERLDGSGYPRQLQGADIKPNAEVLALAEMCAGIFEHASQPVGQLVTALKLQPQQFSTGLREWAQTLADSLPCEQNRPASGAQLTSALTMLRTRFDMVEEELRQLAAVIGSDDGRRLHDNLQLRMHSLLRAFNSTGLGMVPAEVLDGDDDEARQVRQELRWVVTESNWVMHHLSRDLARQRLTLTVQEAEHFEGLTVILLPLGAELAFAGS